MWIIWLLLDISSSRCFCCCSISTTLAFWWLDDCLEELLRPYCTVHSSRGLFMNITRFELRASDAKKKMLPVGIVIISHNLVSLCVRIFLELYGWLIENIFVARCQIKYFCSEIIYFEDVLWWRSCHVAVSYHIENSQDSNRITQKVAYHTQ